MPTAEHVLGALSRRGPSRAPELAAHLRVTRSALQRSLAAAAGHLLVVGKARARTYAARRAVEGVVTPLPVFEVDRSGAVRRALTLHPVEPFGWYVEGHEPDVESGFHEADRADPGPDPTCDLPWFLLDAKPSGFLGRAWVRAHGEQRWPADLARWSGDHVLRYATHYGTDLPGSFVLGDFALEMVQKRVLADTAEVRQGDEEDAYPRLAATALTEAPWGSSPGGEQPKFAVTTNARKCIVKFSPPVEAPAGRRWADLLYVEHLAHTVLADVGIASCTSRIVSGGGRRFLEVERFDRHGELGRSGLISLRALDRAGVAADLRRWSSVTAALVVQGRLAADEHARVEWIEAFGTLIANTDMHAANLSLRTRGTRILGLAPVYDMLPMFHAPRHGGELVDVLFHPASERIDFPESAKAAARELWGRAAGSPEVSDGFRRIAERQARLLP